MLHQITILCTPTQQQEGWNIPHRLVAQRRLAGAGKPFARVAEIGWGEGLNGTRFDWKGKSGCVQGDMFGGRDMHQIKTPFLCLIHLHRSTHTFTHDLSVAQIQVDP